MAESIAVAGPGSEPRSRLWAWLRATLARCGARPPRQLRLRENVPLGGQRFVAVLQFERQNFLIAGTHDSISLLARLESGGEPEADDSAAERRPWK